MDAENQILDADTVSKGKPVVPVKWKVRLANIIVDFIVLGIILNVLEGPMMVSEFTFAMYRLLGPAIAFGYFFVLEWKLGKTIGKMVTRTHVVLDDGNKPDAGTIAFRTLCRAIPFEQFTFFGESGVGWHDRFSKTRVVADE